jgi:hypothetical protein
MVNFDKRSLQKFLKRVEHCKKFGVKNSKKITQINRDVSKVYVNALRTSIVNAEEDFHVYRGGSIYRTVTPGTLRRSIKSWKPERGSNRIMAGPRRGGSERSDGWYAGIVESGYTGTSQSKNTTNRGVFYDNKKRTVPQMRTQQYARYRSEFQKYMK